MQGERASGMLADGIYKGEFVLDDYAMYDLGPFPGIKESPGEMVFGEVYEIPDCLIPKMDSYEGEGSLYKRVLVNVSNETVSLDAYAYVYLQSVSGEIIRTKWNAHRKDNNNMEYIFSIVKKYIDKYDFYDLLALGAPRDEYDMESHKISRLISCDSTTDEIAKVIYKVLHRAFGDISDDFAMKSAAKLRIVIKKVRQKSLFTSLVQPVAVKMFNIF